MKRLLLAVMIGAALAAGFWRYRQVQNTPPDEASVEKPAALPGAEWLERLYSQNPREVEAATEEIRRLGAAALPAIQATLRDPDSEANELKAALKACTILGRTAAPIVAEVAEVLAEPGLTAEAAVALSYMGAEAFPPLRAALSSQDPVVRREALRSIGKLHERAALNTNVVLPLLIERTDDSDAAVRAVAATYLGIMHEDADRSIPALIKGLSDTDPEVRLASAAAIGSFDPAAAAAALPALRRAARDENPDVAREAAVTIVKLGKR